MSKGKLKYNRRGSILILALWTLGLLTVFAVQIGLTVRQRVTLLSRIETRSQLRLLAASGVKKAIALLRKDFDPSVMAASAYSKFYRYNNPDAFEDIRMGLGSYAVSYEEPSDMVSGGKIIFGVQDEEGKLNINRASKDELMRLMTAVLFLSDKESQALAEAMIDWRQKGKSRMTGFYSDEYYSNLEFPYEPKDMEFETFDELLLLEGMTPVAFQKLFSFVTIYGDGLVNVNTASRPVLLALGLKQKLVDKFLVVRRGLDGQDNTADDYVFERPFDIASEMKKILELDPDEAKEIDELNSVGKIKTGSAFYRIESQGRMSQRQEMLGVVSVYNAKDGHIEYWREK